MSDVTVPSQALPEAAQPPAISAREIWPWTLLGLALTAVFAIVASDAGAVGGTVLHEWVHDGRHLLGFPCH